MVKPDVWAAARMPPMQITGYGGAGDYLCLPCLERRLGRALRPEDFTDLPVNDESPWDTPLLAARKRGETI
jgi:hypothetical protein